MTAKAASHWELFLQQTYFSMFLQCTSYVISDKLEALMVIGSYPFLHKSQIAWYDSVIDMDRNRVKIISNKIKEPHNSVASPVLGIQGTAH